MYASLPDYFILILNYGLVNNKVLANVKIMLLTIFTLSAFVIALVELSGVSTTAFINIYNPSKGEPVLTRVSGSDSTQQRLITMPKTTMRFEDTLYNFGRVKVGDSVTHSFKFTNTGKIPLLVAKVEVTCGCTVASFSKDPVLPGKEGEILVTYNSFGKSGIEHKHLSVYANTEPIVTKFAFTAEVN